MPIPKQSYDIPSTVYGYREVDVNFNLLKMLYLQHIFHENLIRLPFSFFVLALLIFQSAANSGSRRLACVKSGVENPDPAVHRGSIFRHVRLG